jgi:putative holliday junction resolvase
MSTWLGLDVGTQLIGVAVGTTVTQTARPLTSVRYEPIEQRWIDLMKLEREWRPEGYVVGLPLLLDGSEQKITQIARVFAAQWEVMVKKPVKLIDERSTTKAAKAIFAEKRALGQSKRKQSEAVDAWAAAIILERYLANAI